MTKSKLTNVLEQLSKKQQQLPALVVNKLPDVNSMSKEEKDLLSIQVALGDKITISAHLADFCRNILYDTNVAVHFMDRREGFHTLIGKMDRVYFGSNDFRLDFHKKPFRLMKQAIGDTSFWSDFVIAIAELSPQAKRATFKDDTDQSHFLEVVSQFGTVAEKRTLFGDLMIGDCFQDRYNGPLLRKIPLRHARRFKSGRFEMTSAVYADTDEPFFGEGAFEGFSEERYSGKIPIIPVTFPYEEKMDAIFKELPEGTKSKLYAKWYSELLALRREKEIEQQA